MRSKPKAEAKIKQDGPLKVPFEFDDAIRRAMTVKPPEEGWPQYEANLRRAKARAAQRKKTD